MKPINYYRDQFKKTANIQQLFIELLGDYAKALEYAERTPNELDELDKRGTEYQIYAVGYNDAIRTIKGDGNVCRLG